MFQASEIKRIIEAELPGARAVVIDEANDGEHFVAEVVSPTFEGKGLVAQHQQVYKALGSLMGGAIHALALKTYTPEQWAKAGRS
ncbi:MAG: BolA family protein [Myxococcota bacterium]